MNFNTIIVPAAAANTSAHTYTQIYASAAASPVVNGVTISLAAGTTLDIAVTSISPTANVFLLGSSYSAANGTPFGGGNVILG